MSICALRYLAMQLATASCRVERYRCYAFEDTCAATRVLRDVQRPHCTVQTYQVITLAWLRTRGDTCGYVLLHTSKCLSLQKRCCKPAQQMPVAMITVNRYDLHKTERVQACTAQASLSEHTFRTGLSSRSEPYLRYCCNSSSSSTTAAAAAPPHAHTTC